MEGIPEAAVGGAAAGAPVGIAGVEAVVLAEAMAAVAAAVGTVEAEDIAAAGAGEVTAVAVDRIVLRAEVADRVPPRATMVEAVHRPGLRAAEGRAEKQHRPNRKTVEEEGRRRTETMTPAG